LDIIIYGKSSKYYMDVIRPFIIPYMLYDNMSKSVKI